MTRPSKNSSVDYKVSQDLTHGLLERALCPEGVPFVLLKDSAKKGLRLRVTRAGGKHWQFETRVKGKLFTRALGEWPAVPIGAARAQAHILRGLTEQGTDPRELERQQRAARVATQLADVARIESDKVAAANASLTVGEVWNAYRAERRPFWGDLHYRDHVDKAKPGGLPSGRRGGGKQLTRPGPLAALMPLALIDLDQATIEKWAANEGKTRPSSARLAWRLLTVFLTWCGEQPAYAALLPSKNPAKTKKAREALGKAGTKSDVLQRGQLAAWFSAVREIQNPVVAAYLQTLLLTGARPGEVLGLRWDDLNTRWKGINIRDKVEGTREIPATPYVLQMLAALPRRNEWVFASARTLNMDAHNIKRREAKADRRGERAPAGEVLQTSASGHISEPNTPHTRACRAAGLEGLTLNGLRRSFKSLTEWLEVPVGVVAQIQGHKPSATAEKHYTVRPLELLRMHHERIEAWILKEAGIGLNSVAEPAGQVARIGGGT